MHIILTRDGMRSCLYVAGLGAQVWFEQFRLRLRPGTCSYVDALQVLCVLCSDHTRNIYMPYPVRVRDRRYDPDDYNDTRMIGEGVGPRSAIIV
jgi:hypothetical protein